MFETSLNQEYQVLAEHFGFTLAELEQASLNALQASFLSAAEKARLAADFQAEFTRLHEVP
jgi:adenosine deaminase